MKIVADKSIPFIEGVFEPYADIIYKEGPAISREDLTDAEALIIRTRLHTCLPCMEITRSEYQCPGTASKVILSALCSRLSSRRLFFEFSLESLLLSFKFILTCFEFIFNLSILLIDFLKVRFYFKD